MPTFNRVTFTVVVDLPVYYDVERTRNVLKEAISNEVGDAGDFTGDEDDRLEYLATAVNSVGILSREQITKLRRPPCSYCGTRGHEGGCRAHEQHDAELTRADVI